MQVLDSDGKVAGTTEPALADEPRAVRRPRCARCAAASTHRRRPSWRCDEDLRLAAAPAEDDGEDLHRDRGRLARAARRRRSPTSAACCCSAARSRCCSRRSRATAWPPARCGRSSTCGAGRRSCSPSGEAGRRLPVPPAHDEISNLGTTLNEMLARIDRAFERERAFTSDASHELRTPLSILKAEVDLALEGERSREELVAALRVRVRGDRPPEPARRGPAGARARRRGAAAAVGRAAGARRARAARGRALRRARRGGGPRAAASTGTAVRVSADPLRLDQALTNLIDNALRYGAGDVACTPRGSDGHAELHVTDDGAGFPPELEDRAFDRFARAAARARGRRARPLDRRRDRPRARRQRPRRDPSRGRRRRLDLAARRRLTVL